MKNRKLTQLTAMVVIASTLLLGMVGCDDASVASHNLSKQGDMFELNRRVVFYNGITGAYMLVIEGRLSIKADDMDNQLEVTVKTGPTQFKKHTLGLSDNVTYFCEQLDASAVDVYHYKVLFKPAAIVPDVDLIN
jgi:hypothetical protein